MNVFYSKDNLVALHFKYDQARRRFVEKAQNEIVVVPDFHKRILFSDEAHFWLNGYVNKQNCRIWSEANPQVYVETPLHPGKLTVWCALWAGGIIGPYFFKNDEGHNVTVNGDRYRTMITNFFIPELNNQDVQELSLAAICGAKVAHATSYHPQCNGIVERLHRTLKRAIKAHNNIKWTVTLPTILLGLRTALRPDTNHTIAQMVYGSNIRLAGEFFNQPSIQIDPGTFVTTLQTFMDELKPTKSSPPKNQKIFVHKDLKSCTHVFVRVDRVRKALEPSKRKI
ncbi:retrovirus-related Pol polyprotein from transposon opus [Trichonephila clavipes]|nr:retrovirus-related Pol polyprotein from transposon opus [Trichonephila clavipes]